ncbi:hypothetical protein BS78_09G011600 [Paspalum vaginatum]|nr:hypothetical protein BS78_09G011600 [Paspalum vaginatum]
MAATSGVVAAAGANIFRRGFRFNPSPEEAIAYYLPRLLAGGKGLHELVRPYIHVADVYRSEPDDLVRRFEPLPVTGARFFFASCKKRSRAAPGGRSTWHVGGTVPVHDGAGVKIGECRKLRHKMNGAYTEWLMDEVVSSGLRNGDTEFVFCKMYVSPRATTTRQDSAHAAAPGGVVLTQAASKIFPVPAAPATAVFKQQAAAAAPKNNFAVPAAYLQAVVKQQVQVPPNNLAVPAPRAPKTFTTVTAPPATPSFAAPKRPSPQVAVPPCPKRARDAHALPANSFTVTAPPVVQQQPAAVGYTTNRGLMAPASTPFVTPRPPSSSPAPAAQPSLPAPLIAYHCAPQAASFQKKQSSRDTFEGAEEEEEAGATTTDPPSEDLSAAFEDDDAFLKTIEDSLEVMEDVDDDLLAKMQTHHSPAPQLVAPTTGCTTASFPAPPPSVEPPVEFEEDVDYTKLVDDAIEAIDNSPEPGRLAAPVTGRTAAPPRRRALLYKEQMPSFLISAPRPRAANKGRDRNRMQ